MKNIDELTKEEGKEILKFVYPPDNEKYKYWYFTELSFKPKITSEGHQQITMDGRSIIGIQFRNASGDGCLLPFDNSKVVLWLYEHGYDILSLLKVNSYFSEMEDDFHEVAYLIGNTVCGINKIREGYKHTYTLESIEKKVKETLDKYYYNKDYE